MGWIPWRYWNIVELPGRLEGHERLECLECLWSNWSCLECHVKHTDAFFRRSPCLLCVEFLETGL